MKPQTQIFVYRWLKFNHVNHLSTFMDLYKFYNFKESIVQLQQSRTIIKGKWEIIDG